jgi:SAM-dependent methyltransferase
MDGIDPDRACKAVRGPFAGEDHHRDAPYWQSPDDVVERMLDLAGAGPGDVLIDLGCGDGRICIAAAKRGARAIGIDLDAERIAEAEAAVLAAGVGALVSFRREDLFATRVEEASIVSLYLVPHIHNLLGPRLRTELARGSRVVAHAWPIAGWKPDRVETLPDRRTLCLWAIS